MYGAFRDFDSKDRRLFVTLIYRTPIYYVPFYFLMIPFNNVFHFKPNLSISFCSFTFPTETQ